MLALLRDSPRGRILVLANFSDRPQQVPRHRILEIGFDGPLVDCVTLRELDSWSDVVLDPYEVLWLSREGRVEPLNLAALS